MLMSTIALPPLTVDRAQIEAQRAVAAHELGTQVLHRAGSRAAARVTCTSPRRRADCANRQARRLVVG